jgi:NTE family protein
VFFPSRDIGVMAADFLRENLSTFSLDFLPRRILVRAARSPPGSSADWATYLLFDGEFAQRMMTLGYDDAMARRDDVRAFFE